MDQVSTIMDQVSAKLEPFNKLRFEKNSGLHCAIGKNEYLSKLYIYIMHMCKIKKYMHPHAKRRPSINMIYVFFLSQYRLNHILRQWIA